MKTRHAEARWTGRLRDGDGEIDFESGAFTGAYSHGSRFEEGEGTNPEEMIGGALAGCFAMYLASVLEGEEYPPEELHATAAVTLDTDDLVISRIDLEVEGDVPGIDAEGFQAAAEEAKAGCPVSKALDVPEITVTASLRE
jgi:osmotically inducible protein OsmC